MLNIKGFLVLSALVVSEAIRLLNENNMDCFLCKTAVEHFEFNSTETAILEKVCKDNKECEYIGSMLLNKVYSEDICLELKMCEAKLLLG
jgi:hypothetical protein